MKKLKDLEKKTLCILAFAIVLTAFVAYSLVFIYVIDLGDCARMEYGGVIANMRSRIEPADLEKMGIPPDSIENITDDTYKMNLIIDELDFAAELNLSVWERHGNDFVSSKIDKKRIVTDHNYAFNLTFIVNSNDPNIQDMKFFNDTNTLEGYFSIDAEHNLNVSISSNYDMTGNNTDGVNISMPYHFSLYFGVLEEFYFD
jgi:hypothetical protein